MLKLIFSIVAALLIAGQHVLAQSRAQIQVEKTLVCTDALGLLEILRDEYKEIPLWVGDSPSGKSKYVLYVNLKTNEWTLLQLVNNLGCIIDAGVGSVVLPTQNSSKTTI